MRSTRPLYLGRPDTRHPNRLKEASRQREEEGEEKKNIVILREQFIIIVKSAL